MSLVSILESTLGLTKIRAHYQLMLLTPIVYHIIYLVGGKLSSIVVPNTYNKYTPYEKSRWNNHIVSLINSITLCVLSVPVLLDQSLASDRVFSYSVGSGNLYAIACGYFIWDLVMCLTQQKPNINFIIHATLCLTVYLISFSPFLNYYGPRFLLFELSTPFLNFGWFLQKLNYDGGVLSKINGLCLFLVFFFARIIWGYYQSYYFWIDMINTFPKGPKHLVIILSTSNFCLNALNTVWFFKLFNLFKKMVLGKGKVKKESINGSVDEKSKSKLIVLLVFIGFATTAPIDEEDHSQKFPGLPELPVDTILVFPVDITLGLPSDISLDNPDLPKLPES